MIISSTLAARAPLVWTRITTMDGVNDELAPWVRMTYPAEFSSLADAEESLLGRVAFHSWLLAGGVVPFDRHSLRLDVVDERGEAGGGFVEESTTLLQSRWCHQRDVVALDGSSCTVTDRLVVVPRLSFARPVVARLVPWLFQRRHQRLVQRFGESPAPDRSI